LIGEQFEESCLKPPARRNSERQMEIALPISQQNMQAA
jgi:hypothetical protein